MSASSDMHNRGYFAHAIKGDEVLIKAWHPWFGPAIDELIAALRTEGLLAEGDVKAEEHAISALIGAHGYGHRLDVGGSYVTAAPDGTRYEFRLQDGYRPGYNPATGRVETNA